MFRFFLILILSSHFANANFGEKDCGSVGKILEIKLDGCTSQPCVIQRGYPYQVYTRFIPSQPSQSLNLNVSVKVWLANLPVVNENACEGISSKTDKGCPYTASEPVEYRKTFTINKTPANSGTVVLKLVDDDGQSQLCFSTKVKIEG